MASKLSPKRAALLSKNPGTRTKVPTAQLSAKHRKMRLANAKNKSTAKPAVPVEDPLTAPLTAKSLDTQVQAATDLYARPAEQEIAGERAVSDQMQRNIPAWFQQYQDALAQSTGATANAYAAAGAMQRNAVDTTAQLSAANDSKQQGAMQSDAAMRGATVDPSLAAEAAQGMVARRASGDAQGALIAGLGAAQTSYRAGQQGVAAGQRLSAQLGEARRGRNTDKASRELAIKKGDYAVTARQKLIDNEHTKQIERKAFNLNVEKAAADVENDAASIAARRAATAASERTAAAGRNTSASNTRAQILARRELQDARLSDSANQKRLDRAAAKERAKITATGTGATPAERRRRADAVNTANQTRDKAVTRAQAIRDAVAKNPPPAGTTPAQVIRRALENEYKDAPKEVLDYALAAALGSKAGVTKKGQPSAAARYYAYLRDLSSGRRSK